MNRWLKNAKKERKKRRKKTILRIRMPTRRKIRLKKSVEIKIITKSLKLNISNGLPILSIDNLVFQYLHRTFEFVFRLRSVRENSTAFAYKT